MQASPTSIEPCVMNGYAAGKAFRSLRALR